MSIVQDGEFQAKMMERIRSAMGDLLPDSVLAEIVKRGVEDAFFKPTTTVVSGSWNNDKRVEPPWTVTFVRAECEKRVAAAVEKWVADNPARIEELVREALSTGLASAALRALDSLLRPGFESVQQRFETVLANLRRS